MFDIFEWLTTVESRYERLFLIIVIIVCTFLAARLMNLILARTFKRSSKVLQVDPTNYAFLRHIMSAIIYLLGLTAIVYTVPSLRALSFSMLAGAGVLAVVIGFASQHAFSNIVSGVFIVIFKPFRVGDRIGIGTDTRGVVEDITLRHTVIRNFENKRIIIPNTIISNEKIENATLLDDKICKWVDFGISYDADIKKARKIIQDEALKHPLLIDNRSDEDKKKKEPVVRVRVIALGDFAVSLRAYVWAKNSADAFAINCDLLESVKGRFDKVGIEIPYPHRTLVMKDSKKRKIVKK